MTMMKVAAQPRLAAARDLRGMMQGEVVALGDDAFAGLRQIWTGAAGERQNLRQVILRAAVSAVALSCIVSGPAQADDDRVARGKYLVTLGGCNDCHTAGYRAGKPDMARFLGGADFAFETPGLGYFVPPNLTPDNATGLGNWSTEQIVTALQTGVRPDGRILSPAMPWRNFANMTRPDALAVVAYLKSLPPVDHKVSGPFGVGDTPPVPILKLVPPRKAASTD